MRPGFTTATKWSGAPLPLPMRVSAGFDVTGLSGKMRIHTLPPRFSSCVIARLAASIWRLSIHAAPIACNPNSPKLTSLPLFAFPRRWPRCCFRNFCRLGCSIFRYSLATAVGAVDAPSPGDGSPGEASPGSCPPPSCRRFGSGAISPL